MSFSCQTGNSTGCRILWVMYIGFSKRHFCPHSTHLSVNFFAFALGVEHCLLKAENIDSYFIQVTQHQHWTSNKKPRPNRFGSLVSLDTHKSLRHAYPSLLQNWRWKPRLKNCDICSTLKTLEAAQVYNQIISFLWEGKRANKASCFTCILQQSIEELEMTSFVWFRGEYMKHFSTYKKPIGCLESRREASTSLVLDETERSKVLITFFKQKFQEIFSWKYSANKDAVQY